MIVCFKLCFSCYLVFRSQFVFCLLLSVCVCCLLPFDWQNKDNHITNLFKYFAGSLSSSPFLTSGTSLHQHMTVMKC